MSPRKESRKNGRIIFDHPLKVVMRSIGADIKYDMSTRNISHTGFFLDFEKPGRFPFTAASIMEIWIELDQHTSIFFNGKMARVVFPGDAAAAETGPGIAVRIVQIDSKNERILFDYIDRKAKERQDKHSHVA
ncbi:MAG: PilZ domain-containing protein [Proteobacteria bacterium]|nr:PilZ domain-containing protein [Pseudomonadota bacterium]